MSTAFGGTESYLAVGATLAITLVKRPQALPARGESDAGVAQEEDGTETAMQPQDVVM